MMETLSEETLPQYLLKRGLSDEIVKKLKDEGFNGNQFMAVDGNLLKLLNFSGSEIMNVLRLQNALRDQPVLNDEEIEEDLRCTEKLKAYVENIDLLNQSSLYEKRVMCNQVEKYEAAVALGCAEFVHKYRPSFFTNDKENKNPSPEKTKKPRGQRKRKTATTTPATRKSARHMTVPLPSQVLSSDAGSFHQTSAVGEISNNSLQATPRPGTPPLEQPATANVHVPPDSPSFSEASDFVSSPVGGTQSPPNLTRTKLMLSNQDRCELVNFQRASESTVNTSTSLQKSPTAHVPAPASPTRPLDFSCAQPLRLFSFSDCFADEESMSVISSSRVNIFEQAPDSSCNLNSVQASGDGSLYSSRSGVFHQPTAKVPVSPPPISGLLAPSSSLSFHQRQTTHVPVSAPSTSGLLARSSSSSSHQQQTTRVPVSAPSTSGLLARPSSSSSHQQQTTRVPVSAPSTSGLLARTSSSSSHQQQTTLVPASGPPNADILARLSSEVSVEEMRKLKPHLPSYDVNSILEARLVDGHVCCDYLKTLTETGYVGKKGRIWVMKCLAAYLYQERVNKSQNERVTMDMKEGMAKSFVLAYPKFAKSVRASDTEMPWSIVLDVRQPSGFLYYSCRPFMKKDRVRKSSKRNADDDDTSHLNENELIERLAVAYPGDSAAEKQVIFEGMKDTFSIRERERQEGKSIESFIEKYVHFASYNGEVIRAEMRLLRPEAQDMCRAFNKLMPAVLKLEPLKPIRLVLEDDVLKALMLISQHLPHDIPLSKRDTSGCAPKEENLVVVATPSDNIKDIIMNKRADAAANQDTVQPYLITVQNPVSKKIMETFLILDNKAVSLKVSTLLHGIDFLFSSKRDKVNNQEYLLLSKIYALQ
ncbi:Exodeoxyribonuclease 7 large subunit [Frankliniella fusca]|uniref:Exodeoxyribonuclease 7 large subunit n=1 Tax=Frankliniella fusca TaxID=407009 RepID=A0AAE1L9Z9_9NEOP|nr:Exodeoxyribonuclease 7 large subunit [Frankliniella fusca]